MSKLTDQIRDAFKGRRALIYLQTPEEDRVVTALQTLAPQCFPGGTLTTWSCLKGLEPAIQGVDTRDPVAAIEQIVTHPRPGCYLMKDLSAYLADPRVARALRDAYYTLAGDYRTCVVLVSPTVVLPETLEKEISFIEVEMPDSDELLAQALEVQKLYPTVQLTPKFQSELALSLRGLTLQETSHVLYRVFSAGAATEKTILEGVFAEKKVLARKSGYLEFVPLKTDMTKVGGLGSVKEWALQRTNLFTQEAVKAGAPIPKGVLVMGISGCGKSMLAKAIAGLWQVPLFRLDMNLVFSGLYGRPEAAFHRALKTIEALAPAVLWIDEIESSFCTPKDSASSQSLTFTAFLTWMQEKPPLVFVAATANRIETLPAEIIRKGRFDQVFFCDLPDESERREILNIHLKSNGAQPGDVDIEPILVHTKGWSGSEIEQAIVAARIDAMQGGRRMNTNDLRKYTTTMVPLSKTMSEQIKAIRDWAFDRATPASQGKRNY